MREGESERARLFDRGRWRERRWGREGGRGMERWREGLRGHRIWRVHGRGRHERFYSRMDSNQRRDDLTRREEVDRRFSSNAGASQREDGWQVVRRRNGASRGVMRPMKTDLAISSKVENSDGLLSSFFFSNFPEHYQAKDLLAVFKSYGKAQEVVIPARRDKNGRRFGFVRFLDVKKPHTFAVKLDNIFLEKMKLFVNQTRFDRVGVETIHKKQLNDKVVSEFKKAQSPCQVWVAKKQGRYLSKPLR